jgi:hypothetical protein
MSSLRPSPGRKAFRRPISISTPPPQKIGRCFEQKAALAMIGQKDGGRNISGPE